MDFGRQEPQSNRATFKRQYRLVDSETGDLLDLTDRTIVFEIVRPGDCRAVLSATTDNGKIVIVDLGIFEVTFDRSELTGLCPQTYNLGITVADDDETDQAIIGTIPIVGGVVAR
jgi:hypothetical protein